VLLIDQAPTPLDELDTHVTSSEGRMTSLGRPPWSHISRLRIAGTSRWVDVRAGLYLEEQPGLGVYYSKHGESHLCNRQAAWQMAFEEDVPFEVVWAGEHTGAVACVNYHYDPAGQSRT
jgi:hypothetical protein